MRAFAKQYDAVFGAAWPVWPAAILVAVTNVFLFAFDRPFTAADGMRHWGDWMLRGVGVGASRASELLPPWLYAGSLLNFGVIAGALVASLLSREFALRVPARGELLKGVIGGALLGVGAMLALGCNIGGFVSATSALSLSGLAMMLGLLVGAILGLTYLVWEVEHRPGWSSGRARVFAAARPEGRSRQAFVGLAVLVALLALPWLYARAGFSSRGLFLLFGAAFGIIFQRSRFCLVRAFREPFMTGAADHTRAAALSIVVSMLGFAVLKFADLKDKGDWVFPSAGAGALVGGLLFGIGMVLAGGCGVGSIWRAGEGQVKLWIALLAFALAASATRLALASTGLQSRLGSAVFLPSPLGWAGAIGLVIAVMAAWAIFATWNEESGRFTRA